MPPIALTIFCTAAFVLLVIIAVCVAKLVQTLLHYQRFIARAVAEHLDCKRPQSLRMSVTFGSESKPHCEG